MSSVLVYLLAPYRTEVGSLPARQAIYLDADRLDAAIADGGVYELYGARIAVSDIVEIGRPG